MRLLFVMTPMILKPTGNQLQGLIFSHSMYVIWYGSKRPNAQRGDFRMGLVNLSLQMIIYYHLVLFSDFLLDPMLKYHIGYTLLICLGLIAASNIAYIVWYQLVTFLRLRHLRSIKAKKLKEFEDIDRQRNPEKYRNKKIVELEEKVQKKREELLMKKIEYGIISVVPKKPQRR